MSSEQIKLEANVRRIQSNITIFTWTAWLCVGVGMIASALGVYKLCIGEAGVPKFSWSALASLGSYFQGAVASIWALAGLLFIYVAFLGQKQQLIQQDAELEDQKRQFKIQNDDLKRQNFESAFFQLLNLHNQIVTTMRYTRDWGGTKDEYIGRRCFESYYDTFKGTLFEPPVKFMERYLWIYDQHQGELGHYFRNLYHLIKFVKEGSALRDNDPLVEYKNRRLYTSLVRATLSQYELVFLFYNCVSRHGEKFKPLVEEFGLLENLNETLLLDVKHKSNYDPKAFA